MGIQDLLGKLDAKTAKQYELAISQETVLLPTASIGLNLALGGGIGRGRLTTVHGNTSAGKSVLFQQSIGQWQKSGLTCAYVDTEKTYDKTWAAKMGVDNEDLILIQSKSAYKISDKATPLLRAGLDVLVIDSISDILPDAFIDEKGEAKSLKDHKKIGAHAQTITRLINQLFYELEDTALVFLSQTTTFIDPNSGMTKQIPHGGQKVPFSSSQIVKLTASDAKDKQKKGLVKVGDRLFEEEVGRRVEFLVQKNKIAPPKRAGSYDFYYAGIGQLGIDSIGELTDLAERFGIIEPAGAWKKLNGQSFQGRDGILKHFKENPDVFESVKADLNVRMTGELPEADVSEDELL